jgi:hypothetical protein
MDHRNRRPRRAASASLACRVVPPLARGGRRSRAQKRRQPCASSLRSSLRLRALVACSHRLSGLRSSLRCGSQLAPGGGGSRRQDGLLEICREINKFVKAPVIEADDWRLESRNAVGARAAFAFSSTMKCCGHQASPNRSTCCIENDWWWS